MTKNQIPMKSQIPRNNAGFCGVHARGWERGAIAEGIRGFILRCRGLDIIVVSWGFWVSGYGIAGDDSIAVSVCGGFGARGGCGAGADEIWIGGVVDGGGVGAVA